MFYEVVMPESLSVQESGQLANNLCVALNDLGRNEITAKIVNTLDHQKGESGISIRIKNKNYGDINTTNT